MTAELFRDELKQMYPLSTKWAAKVDAMPYRQVVAIHIRYSKLLDEEKELEQKKQELREALLDEESPKTDESHIQDKLFKESI